MTEEAAHGSWLGDAASEWRKLPTGGKIAVGLVGLAVIGVGYYEFTKGKSSGISPSGTNAPSGADLSGAGAGQYPTVPGGNTGTVPILPGGVCPIFDSSGNLVAFGPCTGSTSGTNQPPGPTPSPSGDCPTGMHKGKISGLCKCNEKNMINLGDHCIPIGSNKTNTASSNTAQQSSDVSTQRPSLAMASVGGTQFVPSTRQGQRYITNDNGHMQTAVYHGKPGQGNQISVRKPPIGTMPPNRVR